MVFPSPTIKPGTLRVWPAGAPSTSLIGGTTQGEIIAFNGTNFGFK